MSGIEREPSIDWQAAARLDRLMTDRGWNPRDVERASVKTGHPARRAAYRTIYRILATGHRPSRPVQFEIAAAFGLLPSHIWGTVPIPAEHDHAAAAA